MFKYLETLEALNENVGCLKINQILLRANNLKQDLILALVFGPQ